MPTTLLENVNSDLLAAFSALQPKGTAQRVLVYVESDDDISFWRGVLDPFERYGIRFDIHLPIQDNFAARGKPAVLEFSNRAGSNLILCVDSDYDYLLQNTTEQSLGINSNPYIFQTYAYSIENFQCYAKSLHLVCAQSSKNDKRLIDFEVFMSFYSAIVYPLFLWSVHFLMKKDYYSFPLSEFWNTIKILDKVNYEEQFDTVIKGIKARVMEKVDILEHQFAHDIPHITTLAKDMRDLGVEPENTYLFIQGHTLRENVVIILLKHLVHELSNQKFAQINQIADENVRNQQRRHYKRQITPVESVLNSNTEFRDCSLFEKIEKDLEVYVQGFITTNKRSA